MRADHEQALAILRTALGNPAATFRDGQWEAIEALVERHAKLLVVRQTGWGRVWSTSWPRACCVSREVVPRC